MHAHIMPRHTSCRRPSRPQPHVGQQLLSVAKAYSSNPYPSAQQQPQGSQDLLGGVLDLCFSTCSRITHVAVEVAVKGALFLLGLGLVKGAINAVLLVGCIVLVLYTATQVFGMNAVVLGRDSQTGTGAWQQSGSQQQRWQQQQQAYNQQQHRRPPGYGSSSRQQQQQPSQQWQQQQPWQQHRTWPSSGGEGIAQEDVVDVHRGPAA